MLCEPTSTRPCGWSTRRLLRTVSCFRAHCDRIGRGPRPKPIFTGSNDPTYRILAGWVNSLSTPKTSNDVARADQQPTRVKQAEAFAMDRNRGSSDQLNLGTEVLSTDGGRARSPPVFPSIAKSLPPRGSNAVAARFLKVRIQETPRSFRCRS